MNILPVLSTLAAVPAHQYQLPVPERALTALGRYPRAFECPEFRRHFQGDTSNLRFPGITSI